jgi:hypothetical protein
LGFCGGGEVGLVAFCLFGGHVVRRFIVFD